MCYLTFHLQSSAKQRITWLLKIKPASRPMTHQRLSCLGLMRSWKTLSRNLVCPSFLLTSSPHSFQFTVVAKETWRSPIYSFFKPEVTIKIHIAHFFTCSAKKCKTGASSIQHFQDKGNKSSTANLHHHAVHCFGEDTVNEAVGGESGGSQSSNIFSTFVSQGQCPVTYSYCAHLTPEFQRVPNNLSFFDLCILVPTLLNG